MSDAWNRQQEWLAQQREVQRQQDQRLERQRQDAAAEVWRQQLAREEAVRAAAEAERKQRFPCPVCGGIISVLPCTYCRAREKAEQEGRRSFSSARIWPPDDSSPAIVTQDASYAPHHTFPVAASLSAEERRYLEAFEGTLGDCPELCRLWERASQRQAESEGRPLTWDTVRRKFWRLVAEDVSPDADFVRRLLHAAGYELRKNGRAPLLRMDWKSHNIFRRLAARRLSLDHVVPRSRDQESVLDPSNLRFMQADENGRRSDELRAWKREMLEVEGRSRFPCSSCGGIIAYYPCIYCAARERAAGTGNRA